MADVKGAPVRLSRRLFDEALGTALLVTAVVGSGIAAQQLSPGNVGVQLARTGRSALTAGAVGADIGAAYWFTSSTSFANPAVTIGRVLTDTFAGIAPGSVPLYVAAQIIGGAIGVGLVLVLIPHPATVTHTAVVTQQSTVSPSTITQEA